MSGQQTAGKLCYSTDDPGVIYFNYNGCRYKLESHPYEPCLYIISGDCIICTLHTAFTTIKLIATFSKGESVNAVNCKDYDEAAFVKVLAAALGSGREQLDFTYAAKLAEKEI